MKLSTVFWTAFVTANIAAGQAIISSPDAAHDIALEPATRPSQHRNVQKPSHLQALSIRSPSDDDGDYPSAEAEAMALGLSGGFRTIPTAPRTRRSFNIAHGTLMALAFTLWFPAGAILMHTTHQVWLHAAVQSFAYVNAIAGMGLGIWLGRNVRYLDYAHTVIGMAVMAALVFQVALGVWTHGRFVAEKRRKAEGDVVMHGVRKFVTWGFVHRWLGRSLIALAIINGGLGLKLAQNTKGGEIAYGIVAGIVGSVYLSLLVMRTWRRYRVTKDEVATPQGVMMA